MSKVKVHIKGTDIRVLYFQRRPPRFYDGKVSIEKIYFGNAFIGARIIMEDNA